MASVGTVSFFDSSENNKDANMGCVGIIVILIIVVLILYGLRACVS